MNGMKKKRHISKKWLMAAPMVLACGWIWSQEAAGPAGAPIPGDVNGDGQVDISDARTVLLEAVGALQPSAVAQQGLPTNPPTTAQINYGRYLGVTGGCDSCHNRSGGTNPSDPNWLAGYIQGMTGGAFQIGPKMFKVYAANLTPDPNTGLGKWTAQDIFNALRNGKDPAGHYLAPPMPWPTIRGKSDADLWAIAAYLKSIKPVANAVPEPEGPAQNADGTADWSSSYATLKPPFIPYPGTNE
jgi:cytochrome c553